MILNLQGEFEADEIWRNNALYVLSNRIREAYPTILQKLKDEQVSSYSRDEVAKFFLETTSDIDSLLKIAKETSLSRFHWNIIRLIIPKAADNKKLVEYLKSILENETQDAANRVLAAKDLMRLNNLDGLEFYATHLERIGKPDDNYGYNGAGLERIKDVRALPTLIQLLALSKQLAFQKDDFNSLERRILDTLFNIGVASKENLELVKGALEKFIKENTGKIDGVNFLYSSIQRMDEHFYEQQSQAMTLKEAVYNVDQLYN